MEYGDSDFAAKSSFFPDRGSNCLHASGALDPQQGLSKGRNSETVLVPYAMDGSRDSGAATLFFSVRVGREQL